MAERGEERRDWCQSTEDRRGGRIRVSKETEGEEEGEKVEAT